MFGISPIQMLICGIVAVLLFGSRLPSVARSLGKSLTEFKRGLHDLQHEFSSAMNEADRAATNAAEGTQARLPGDGVRDDSFGDEVYDHDYGDYQCDSEVALAENAAEDASEGSDANTSDENNAESERSNKKTAEA